MVQLHRWTVQGKPKGFAVIVLTRDNPAVNSAVGIADRIDGGGSELEHKKDAVIEAEDLGATV